MNTLIELKYTDADNYKKFQDVVLEGEITAEQIGLLVSKLEDQQFIIAEQVGLPTPAQQFDEDFEFPTEKDHVWTEVVAFESGTPSPQDMLTDQDPTIAMTVVEFADKLEQLGEWDISKEMDRLELFD